MAYGLKYTVQSFVKGSQMFTAEIYEKDYTGSSYEVDPGDSPFVQALLAQSDEQFDPVLATDLKINANITDFGTTLPDLTSNNDRKYWVKLKSLYGPLPNKSIILWRMYKSSLPTFLDCNLQIKVNGITTLLEFNNNTGALMVDTTDIVKVELDVFILPGAATLPAWQLRVLANGLEVYNVITPTPSIGEVLSYEFIAGNGVVYTILCQSIQSGDPGKSIPTNDENKLFQGFLLTDNASMPFTTGYKGLQFSNTDGFSMLKNIPYVPTNRDINILESFKTIILNCLNKIEYPDGFKLNICVSVYANGMNNRGTGTQYEPFSQAYYPPRNWLNSRTVPLVGVENLSAYMSCYDVLVKILTSWGCQLKQSESEFWILSVNEQANANIYFTKYDQNGVLISSGTRALKKTIAAYSETADHYFQENTQVKLLRKGFPDIQLKCPAVYAPQCVDNGDMSVLDGGSNTGLANWGWNSVGSLTLTSLGPFAALRIAPTGGGPTQRTPSINAGSVAKAYAGDTLDLSFWIDGQATPSPTVPKCWLRIIITTPTADNYWMNQDGNWIKETIPTPIGNYNVIGSSSSAYESVSVTSKVIPQSGTVSITWLTDNFNTAICTIANVVMTFKSPYEYRLIRNTVTDRSYQKNVKLPIGGASDTYSPNQLGSILKSDGTVWDAWYRYGRTESFGELMRLVYQQYFNICSRSSINIDCSIGSLFSKSRVPLLPANAFAIDDTTGKLSINGKSYTLGNATFNWYNDQLDCTLLEVSDTDIAATITDRVIPKTSG